ncbi:DUF4335 domain-containing protein [Nodosilinea sp. LEGE 07298]|uniref:DUF4335 domain-containing protein n=1 Tax=Nodosilinea sp. LEGE 07298 TaxID=2777970 RepID=UPI001880B7E9|nr:DUF4335 domain-containing protein [Nodosilinea sp. LEGE 07298]MBE9111735.1 DUF4335 domain-containing protein [Nodosilinea sp. LEGE 07298]
MAAIATVTSYEYAAGTCTLRLVGELSPLSQVTGRPVLGRSRFSLQMYGEEADAAIAAATNQAVIFDVSGREPQFSALAGLVQTYVQRHLNADALTAGGAVSQGDSAIQPVGLTRHRLTLATPPEPPKIVELSTLQLADLADALEQADGNLQIIPDHALPKTRWVRPKLPLWIGSIAAVGIAALLGNQLLTTAPSSVVLSPSEPQTTNESTRQLPPSSSQQPTQGDAPAVDSPAAESVESPSAAGEALPTPTTTAPTTPAAPATRPTDVTPKTSPPPSATSPAPATSNGTSPAPDAPPQAEARAGGAQLARPDSNTAAEPAPVPTSPSADRSAPDTPEAFEASPEIAATRAPDAALDWVAALRQALQQQWRSPANLAAPLRYRITLEPDGTVETLEPLDDLSATYQDNPTLPQPGTTIPGIARDESTTVEVQFLPTGEVVVELPDS